jgi:hypothetical protein
MNGVPVRGASKTLYSWTLSRVSSTMVRPLIKSSDNKRWLTGLPGAVSFTSILFYFLISLIALF